MGLCCPVGKAPDREQCSSPACPSTLSDGLLCETGNFSCCIHSEYQFPLKSAQPTQPVSARQAAQSPRPSNWPWLFSEGLQACVVWHLTILVVVIDFFFFFNSLVVRVPFSLIFWCFWLFIDFRLVVILLLVVQGSERFLPTPPSWPELWKVYSKGKKESILYCWLFEVQGYL